MPFQNTKSVDNDKSLTDIIKIRRKENSHVKEIISEIDNFCGNTIKKDIWDRYSCKFIKNIIDTKRSRLTLQKSEINEIYNDIKSNAGNSKYCNYDAGMECLDAVEALYKKECLKKNLRTVDGYTNTQILKECILNYKRQIILSYKNTKHNNLSIDKTLEVYKNELIEAYNLGIEFKLDVQKEKSEIKKIKALQELEEIADKEMQRNNEDIIAKCRSILNEFKELTEIAGFESVYEYIFNEADPTNINAFSVRGLHRLFYKYSTNPEYAGNFKSMNNYIGAYVETADSSEIFFKVNNLDSEIQSLIQEMDLLSNIEYIDRAVKIHYSLVTMQPFLDGNKRTSMAFLNWLLLIKQIPPIYTSKSSEMYRNYSKSIAEVQHLEYEKITKNGQSDIQPFLELQNVIHSIIYESIIRIKMLNN